VRRIHVPDVSVIVPTRDRRARLGLTLQSVLWQRSVDLEIVVVDDGSSDRTSEMIARMRDQRIRLVRNPVPLGEGGARNRGVEHAAAPWIAFLDDDDLWAPDKLRRQLDAVRRAGAGWVYAGDVVIDDDLEILHGARPPPPRQVMRDLMRHNAVPAGASNVLVDASLLARVGPFDPELHRTTDWDMWLRLARVGPPTWVPLPLVANCAHPASISRDMEMLFAELPLIAERHGVRVDRARHYRWAAWNSLLEQRRSQALRYYAKAIAVGDAVSIVRALSAIVLPQYARRRTAASPAATERDPWLRQAGTWLDALSALRRDPDLPPTDPPSP
jgi:glycosyltransferase involved in cell wall biosynthesis